MGQLLSHPLTEKTIIQDNDPHSRFNVTTGSMQGYRLTQEDSHFVYSSPNTHVTLYDPFHMKYVTYPISIFAVCDGHGGPECSTFIASKHADSSSHNTSAKNSDLPQQIPSLARCIIYSLENHKYGAITNGPSITKSNSNNSTTETNNLSDSNTLQPSSKRQFATIQGLVAQCIKDAFHLQDKAFYRYHSNSQCGSTAIVSVIIDHTHLFVANIGDSRCILSTKNKGIKPLSFDHKPQHIGELLRINDNGGTVSLGRVGGVLALSRAFGDFQFKKNVDLHVKSSKFKNNTSNTAQPIPKLGFRNNQRITPYQEAQVSCEPDILTHEINYNKDEFLVLACDGIWDVYNNKQLIQFIKYHLTIGLKFDSVITKLLDHGISKADANTGVGFDNMTCMIVTLNKKNESINDWYSRIKSRLEKERGIV
ncbi:hypothetical protein TBLA_0F03130 [Henningerozyma blattae CBS 6284]|uniref:protein-serine/threonine phosphatase n=1 Tax=Henningerozyma blattae (strain ATCC 34711 / CBS 6284 / DSM 70876 / NBRC 10599 / NRRL Y-10934 / UCD 77-7) TaxID=1071380 RepID=I2H650_HENB6|nr:hypothetical protein TBLA_0F03130 [Tetrapisispora blattae CBS 6284]CCH61852.1 hypothetical protein TBLA_0F03130 [Tetrapisispora blattae CBS 6284]